MTARELTHAPPRSLAWQFRVRSDAPATMTARPQCLSVMAMNPAGCWSIASPGAARRTSFMSCGARACWRSLNRGKEDHAGGTILPGR